MKLEPVTDQNFSEDDYLIANPDVGAAVERRDLVSGRQHFELSGHREGRFQRAPLIFFVHVPKAAGSAVNFHLMEHFPNGSAHCDGWFFDDASMHLLDTLTWVSGHIPYLQASSRVRQFTGRRVEYFACLRNPTEQIGSHYNWLAEIFHRGGIWYNDTPDWVKEISEQIRKSGFSFQAIQENLLKYNWLFLNYQSHFLVKSDKSAVVALDDFKFVSTTDQLTELLFAMIGKEIAVTRRENESLSHFDRQLFCAAEMQSFLREHNSRDEQLFELVRSANKLCNPLEAASILQPWWRRCGQALAVQASRLTATLAR
ncbi:hypothetical protein [Mesorhizobium sp.]|uniref:hypothetical protein n=1 Tax=Mesorhizobium sp. TaxID=1871066 RepID=UPI0012001FD2|nr:hypothetical protein [Mesorhizobium sp.]TIO77087.1 MAG: hypothetical protein E5X75_11510 [Mesorhizobium sp.]